MTIQRIDNQRCSSYGYQARAHVAGGQRLTRFFADDAHGGRLQAYLRAEAAVPALQRKARKLQRQRAATP